MPEISYVRSQIAPPIDFTKSFGDQNMWVFTWETFTENDTCEGLPVNLISADLVIQVTGTFGGGVITLQGSNDGVNWFALLDGKGDAIAISADGLVPAGIAQLPAYIRPHASTAGSSRDVDVVLMAREVRRIH